MIYTVDIVYTVGLVLVYTVDMVDTIDTIEMAEMALRMNTLFHIEYLGHKEFKNIA